MVVVIRTATPEDSTEICAFWNPVILDTAVTFASVEKLPSEVTTLIRGRLSAGHGFMVATDGAVLGFATYSQFRAGAGYATCMEHTIILAETGQGRGIGHALMTALETHAAQGGAHQMIAGVSAENPAGLAFHAACGYAQIARITEAGFKFGRFMDLILMRKFLT